MRLGAFGEAQGFSRSALTREQVDHGVVGRDFGFKVALLLLLSASDLSAQRLDGCDSLFKGLPRLSGSIESAMCGARREEGLTESFGGADPPRQSRRAFGNIQRLHVASLFLMNTTDAAKRDGNPGLILNGLSYLQALPQVFQSLRVVALFIMNPPNVV